MQTRKKQLRKTEEHFSYKCVLELNLQLSTAWENRVVKNVTQMSTFDSLADT